jgi:hypothetical protein
VEEIGTPKAFLFFIDLKKTYLNRSADFTKSSSFFIARIPRKININAISGKMIGILKARISPSIVF